MYENIVNAVAGVLAIFGAAIVLYGGLSAMLQILQKEALKKSVNYNAIRRGFTSKIMVGLEFFVANDLIKTVLEPSLNQVITLAAIVLIRTIISYSLNKELKDLGPEE